MKQLVEPSAVRGRAALLAGVIAFAVLALLCLAHRAEAAENLYWDNYEEDPVSIGSADINGNGGGALNTGGLEIQEPEGIAYDSANGRLYIAASRSDQIIWVSVDNSGAGVLDTGGAPVEDPEGIAVDPTTQTVYWANSEKEGSIGYASASGGSGGVLNTTGAKVEDPYKVAVDTTNGRIYWGATEHIEFENEEEEVVREEDFTLDYANLDGSGGGVLALPATPKIEGLTGIDVDPASGRLYVLGGSEEEEGLYYVNTSGVGGGEVDISGASYNGPYGLAFDPSKERFYWANYDNKTDHSGVFGTVTLAPGGGTAIAVATAPVDGPQDPVVVKSPVETGAPLVSVSGTTLACSQGSWQPDYPGSFVYAAPTGYAYQWFKDGTAIGGATGSTLTVSADGSYGCAVTATNYVGSGVARSADTKITVPKPAPKPTPPAPKPAELRLQSRPTKPITVTPGKPALVKVAIANGGGTASGPARVCAKLNKKTKKGLFAPKCATVGSIVPGGSGVATLRVKTRKGAAGLYTFKVLVNNGALGSFNAKVKVTAAKSAGAR